MDSEDDMIEIDLEYLKKINLRVAEYMQMQMTEKEQLYFADVLNTGIILMRKHSNSKIVEKEENE